MDDQAASRRPAFTHELVLGAGLTFVISSDTCDMDGESIGLVCRDVRHLARCVLRLDGLIIDWLGTEVVEPDTAVVHGVAAVPGHPDPPLEVTRHRRVGQDRMQESVELRWWGPGDAHLEVVIDLGTDFADIFDLRTGDVPETQAGHNDPRDRLTFAAPVGQRATTVTFDPTPETIDANEVRWRTTVARDAPWQLQLTVACVTGEPAPTTPPPPSDSSALRVETVPPELGRAVATSATDLRKLTMRDSLAGDRPVLTAGIPWYVALFGRDSLIASHQALAFGRDRLLGALHALAARQGTVADPANDEAPGKILHEARFAQRAWLGTTSAGPHGAYYGTVDATALFVIMLGQAMRWGASREELAPLLPAGHAALAWLRGPADMDDDGLIEHAVGGERSLVNQGWKDSPNAIQDPNGTLAQGPIALVEVQGYAYRARLEFADVLRWIGDDPPADALVAEATRLRAAIRDRFWVAPTATTPGYFALALDGAKQRIDTIASNMAHLLWCDVPSPDEARDIAAHLTGPGLASGWGLRTLSDRMGGYNPLSYHLGSVWPHDTLIACDGLRRYALDDEAMGLVGALIDALCAFGGRLPELFGGHAREPGRAPVPAPSACSPQAWAAGVAPALIVTLLGLDPQLHRGTVSLSPRLPIGMERLAVGELPLGDGTLALDVDAGGTRVHGVPPGVTIEVSPHRAGLGGSARS